MSLLWQDVRYAARGLAQNPGFTLAVILTLLLGVGANTAIFTVVNAVLVRPLPYDDPRNLVLVWNRVESIDFNKAPVTPADYLDYAAVQGVWQELAATDNTPTASLTGDGEPQQINLSSVTPNFFAALGVPPAIGHVFDKEDGLPYPPGSFAPNAPPPPSVIILSHNLWLRRFSGDPEALGRSILVNGQPMVIVGVMPEGFKLLMPEGAGMVTDVDAWTPFRFDFSRVPRDTNNANLRLLGRLKEGTSLEQAQERMNALAQRNRELFEYHKNGEIHIDLHPMHRDVVGHVRPVILALFGAVGFVLLIACANVANLLLLRAAAREREVAVRAALGGGRRRILQLMFTESALLAAIGGAAGLLTATWGIDLLAALRPANLPRIDNLRIDLPVLAFTFGVSIFAAFLFGLIPAIQASRLDIQSALRDRSGGDRNAARRRLRSLLVVSEVALSMVLLIGAGLMLRSFLHLQEIDPGFRSGSLQTFKVALPFLRYNTVGTRARFFDDLESRLEGLPGVQAVGSTFRLPLGGRFWTGPYASEDAQQAWNKRECDYRAVTPGYFDAMGIRLKRGRLISETDNEQGRRIAVVDEKMAQMTWPGQDPIGKRLFANLFTYSGKNLVEVVGVVENVHHESLSIEARETIYFPHRIQASFGQMTVAVRTGSAPEQLTGLIRSEVEAIDPDLPVFDVRTMDDYVAEAMAPTRFTLVLISVFAVVALVVATIGLYGVISYSVRRRTREIGVHLAFGARQRHIMRMVLGNGLILSVCGIAVGILGSLALTRFTSSFLIGVTSTDPTTYLGVSILLISVALVASYLPARRALRVDPMDALRTE